MTSAGKGGGMSIETAGLPEGWNPYEELGIQHSAGVCDVKTAFRRLARLYHPDKAGRSAQGGKQDFIRVRLAYEILSNSERRAALDAGGGLSDISLGAVGEVDLDDMEWDEKTGVYTHACRCSGVYTISTEQLEGGYNTVCCSCCSLCVTVLYDIDEDVRETDR